MDAPVRSEPVKTSHATRLPVPLTTPTPLHSSPFDSAPALSKEPRRKLDLFEVFGWRSIAGTVIAVEAPYMVKPETSGLWLLSKLVIGILLLPFMVAVIIAGFICSGMWSLFFRFGRHSEEPGFASRLASQVIGYYLTGKLFGPKELVPVRDIRLRGSDAREYLVRIRGELSAGNVAVGDEIEVHGFNRHGTLIFERGINRRTRASILVRHT